MSAVHQIASWTGYCPRCDDDRPLTLLQTGPRGLLAWLSGHADEDRSLSLACRLCGHVDDVPATATEDAEYDATLPRWPDLLPLRRPGAPWPSDVAVVPTSGTRQIVLSAGTVESSYGCGPTTPPAAPENLALAS